MLTQPKNRTRRGVLGAAGAGLALLLAACSTGVGSTSSTSAPSSASSSAGSSAAAAAPKEITLLTHESFNVPDDAFAAFEKTSGQKVIIKKLDSAGVLANQLVLTKDAPIGDAFYGVDNTFGSRVATSGAAAKFTPAGLPPEFATFGLQGDNGATLTPIDHSAVCVVADTAWFKAKNLALPVTLDDLTKPAYQGMLAVPGATGSTGMAFLLATIGAKGEAGWEAYWKALMANKPRIDKDWTQAYESSFTAGGGNGTYPLVVSYDSTPAATVNEAGTESGTVALLDTCFNQVEYGGVVAGAKNPQGAEALIAYMASQPFQELLPDNMYVFPVREAAVLPPVWAKFAKPATKAFKVDPALIDKNRQAWQTQWQQIATS